MGSDLFPFHINKTQIVCFDTETTGLMANAEVCQVAVVDYNLNPIFYRLIKPKDPIPPEATAVHGITNEQVQDSKYIRYHWDYIAGSLFRNKIVTGYNVFYDIRMLMQSIAKIGMENTKSFSPMAVFDTMELFKLYQNSDRWCKLGEACELMGLKAPEVLGAQYHDALYDATMTMLLLRKMMGDDCP